MRNDTWTGPAATEMTRGGCISDLSAEGGNNTLQREEKKKESVMMPRVLVQ